MCHGKSIYQSQAAVLQARRSSDVLHQIHYNKKHTFIILII